MRRRGWANRRLGVLLAVAAAGLVSAQSPARTATSLAAVERYPAFFHGRTIAFVATPTFLDGLWRVPITGRRTLVILPRTGRPPEQPVEIRGGLFDVGRLSQDDSRVSVSGIRGVVQTLMPDRWPERDTLFVIVGATWVEPPAAALATLRSVALTPDAFDGRTVTVRGRFRAQNLFADLPAWPKHSQWDFVLQAADASLWISGMRPRGSGFDLDPTVRRSTGTWLEVTGTVRLENDLPRIDAKTIAATKPDEEMALPPAEPALPIPPPRVIFTAPVDGEQAVNPATVVRVQFSADMKESTFEGRVRVTYGAGTSDPVPVFTVTYKPLTVAIEVRFAAPLARGAAVTIELTDGITTSDGRPLPPSKITFTTAG